MAGKQLEQKIQRTLLSFQPGYFNQNGRAVHVLGEKPGESVPVNQTAAYGKMTVVHQIAVIQMNMPDIGRQCLYKYIGALLSSAEYRRVGIVQTDAEAGYAVKFLREPEQQIGQCFF